MEANAIQQELNRIGEEAKKAAGAVQTEMSEALKGKASAETVEAIKAENAELKAEYEKLKSALEEQGTVLKGKLESATKATNPADAFKEALKKSLQANEEAIKTAISGGAPVKLNLRADKAAETITSANFGTGVLQGLRMAGVEALDRNEQNVLQEITVINGGPGSDPFSVVEKTAVEGGAAPVAEGADKPYYDWNYAEVKATAEMIAAIVPVSKQALLRMPQLYGHIVEELSAEVMETLQTQILYGTGTSPQLKSVDYYASTFTAGGLALAVGTPTAADAIRAIAAQVSRARGRASVIYVHPDTLALLDLTKDANGSYLVPPFATADGTRIGGVRVLPSFDVAAGSFIGGDMKRYMLNIVQDLEIEVGWINDQFRKNQLSIRGEIFAAGLVKAQHTNKLIEGTLSGVITAITKP